MKDSIDTANTEKRKPKTTKCCRLCLIEFPVYVKAIQRLCGYNETAMLFKVPSPLARKVGYSVHKVARQIKTAPTVQSDMSEREGSWFY